MPDAVGKLIQLSMYHYAKYCRDLLALGRSERFVKKALSQKVKGKASDSGIDMVFKLGLDMWLHEKNKALPVIVATNGNHNN